MNLYITDSKIPNLSGLVMSPKNMCVKLAHLTLASRSWDTLFIDLDECIPEGTLRHLAKKCTHIRVCCPAHPSMHQLHLLGELYPEIDGSLRKYYMKGASVHGLLPEMWEHGSAN